MMPIEFDVTSLLGEKVSQIYCDIVPCANVVEDNPFIFDPALQYCKLFEFNMAGGISGRLVECW